MALADRLNRPAAQSGTPCSVGRALAGLKGEELDTFKGLLGTSDNWGREASYIWEVMQEERRDLMAAASKANEAGNRAEAARLQDQADIYNVGHQTVNRHRGKRCRCYKDAA